MNLKSLKYFFFLMMAVITLSSCSEDDDNVSEYANWKERNEQAFADTLAYARKMGEANGWYVYNMVRLVAISWRLQLVTHTLSLSTIVMFLTPLLRSPSAHHDPTPPIPKMSTLAF